MRASSIWRSALVLALTFCHDAGAAEVSTRPRTLVLLVQVQNDRFQLLGAKATDQRTRVIEHAGGELIEYSISDADGNELYSGWIADASLKRGPMPLPGEEANGHALFRVASTAFFLKVPYDPRYAKLRLHSERSSTGAEKTSATGVDVSQVQLLDLTDAMARIAQDR